MEMTCVVCPAGCLLRVEPAGEAPGSPVAVSGGRCPRGAAYAREEAVRPARTLTSTVRLRGAEFGAAPVKSDAPVPKALLPACVKALAGLVLTAPIRKGDLALANVLGAGVNIVATRSIPGSAPEREAAWPNT